MTAGVACFEESGGECLTAKRTFRNGHASEASLALEPWAFVAQGVTGAAIERPFEGVVEDPARGCK